MAGDWAEGTSNPLVKAGLDRLAASGQRDTEWCIRVESRPVTPINICRGGTFAAGLDVVRAAGCQTMTIMNLIEAFVLCSRGLRRDNVD